jgi:hypothetical protein
MEERVWPTAGVLEIGQLWYEPLLAAQECRECQNVGKEMAFAKTWRKNVASVNPRLQLRFCNLGIHHCCSLLRTEMEVQSLSDSPGILPTCCWFGYDRSDSHSSCWATAC